MVARPRQEFLDLTNTNNVLLIQSRLDSMAYRDIFNTIVAAKDSSKVAEFNKIAATIRPSFVSTNAQDCYSEINENLIKQGITVGEHKKIASDSDFVGISWNDIALRFLFNADGWAYRRFFNKIGILDDKLSAKCDSVSQIIMPR